MTRAPSERCGRSKKPAGPKRAWSWVQNAALEARAELRRPESRLIGSVAYFPERYGEDVIPLCLNILQRKPVPPAVFVKHQLATKENVDRLYPNDALISSGGLELLLLKSH